MPPADIPSIRSPVSAEAPTPTSAAINVGQQSLGGLTPGAVGQAFQAQVLSQLEDGSFLVNVANTALRMSLPAGSTVGEALDMTLLATEPRPAFLLEQPGNTTSTSFSSAAQLINIALKAAQQADAPTTLVGKTPLVATPEVDTPLLAEALKSSIDSSGLFYESHLSQWISGDRTLADLLTEPQVMAQAEPPLATGNLAESVATAVTTGSATGLATDMIKEMATDLATDLTTNLAAELVTGSATNAAATSPTASNAATAAQAQAARSANENSTAAGTLLPRPPATDEQLANLMNAVRNAAEARPSLAQALSTILSSGSLPKEADTMVRTQALTQENAQTINLQLNALEQNRVAWRGELWPGQRMEWEISEEDGGSSQGGQPGNGQKTWQSVVRFDLPKLGKVSAAIHLSGGHVIMQLSARSGDSVAVLKARGGELASALDAAGTPLDLLTVKQDEQV